MLMIEETVAGSTSSSSIFALNDLHAGVEGSLVVTSIKLGSNGVVDRSGIARSVPRLKSI